MNEQNKTVWPGWQTVRVLGRGSYGSVYEVQRDVFGHQEKAAVKCISLPRDPADLDELRSEGYTTEGLNRRLRGLLEDIVREYTLMSDMKGCANIVYCDDIKTVEHPDGVGWDIFIKMELLTALPQAIPQQPGEAQVVKIAADLCNALSFCEDRKLLHRDIKPQNIFMAPDSTCKLGDFGIAKTIEGTAGGTKAGTYKYMAPEVYNNRPYGQQADIYSLGIVLYWLLNERRAPFLPLPPAVPTAAQEEQARARRFGGEPLPPPKHGSPGLQAIVLRACAFDPRQRYYSAAEILRDLEALSAGRALGGSARTAAGQRGGYEYTAATQQGVYRDPSGSRRDPSGVYRDPSGVYRDPSGVYRDPSGVYRDPSGVYRDPSGVYRDPSGVYRDPSGSRREPAGGYRDPSGGYAGGTAGYSRTASGSVRTAAAPAGSSSVNALRTVLIILGALLCVLVLLVAITVFSGRGGDSSQTSQTPAPQVQSEDGSAAAVIQQEAPESGNRETIEPQIVEPAATAEPLLLSPSTVKTSQLMRLAFRAASASSELVYNGERFAAGNAIDGDVKTSWQEAATGLGIGETLTLSFDGERELSYLQLYLGNQYSQYAYDNNGRPKTLSFRFSDGSVCSYTFSDSMGYTLLQLSRPVTTSYVLITIEAAYDASFQDTCISEVLAFG